MSKRVVITGLGAVTPLGNSAQTFWEGLLQGEVGIDRIKAFDVTDWKVTLAAEVKEFDGPALFGRKEAKRLDRYCQFALAAAKEALHQSGLDITTQNASRVGVIAGSGIGGIRTIETESQKLHSVGPERVSPLFIPMAISNMAAGNISIAIGSKGLCSSVVTACASGTNAIGEAFRLIREGRQDVVFAGASEAAISPLAVAGFASMTALSLSEDPKRASIPFDQMRDGFVMGEGAGILVLEELEHAQKRKAKILAEVCGYGFSSDAYHITSPDPSGEGGYQAMKSALEDGQVEPEQVDYINAHGTSTPFNDKIESKAILRLFQEHAPKVAISSTKSMVGHLLGAAGAVEAIACVYTLQEEKIHPTMGLCIPDPECPLDYVPNQARSRPVQYALSNSLGFGGHNASLLFKKWEV